jgi:hypothetical protein
LAGTFAFSKLGFGWSGYLWCFFIPDISFIGYVFGPKIGAAAYNFAHSYVVPVGILLVGLSLNIQILLAASFIWVSHIGFDRALGFGLKYSKGFSYTHLGLIGKNQANT